jgi:hypothetical protein
MYAILAGPEEGRDQSAKILSNYYVKLECQREKDPIVAEGK